MIDDNIQNELRNKYNPDGSNLRKHQMRMLDILIFVGNFCEENNIKYWLSSGTCLGAVRHGGFIPWDDDVDIEMMREDFLIFQEKFKESDKYVMQTQKTDYYYYTPFHKIREKDTAIYDSLYKYRGVFIDVFCLEYVNRSISVISNYAYRMVNKCYCLVRSKKDNKNKAIYSLLYGITKKIFFAYISFLRIINKIIPNKQLRHTIGVGWPNNIRVEEEIFPLTTMKFEGYDFPVPGNYDAYLSHLYGNYMEIPSDDKIQKPHIQYYQK